MSAAETEKAKIPAEIVAEGEWCELDDCPEGLFVTERGYYGFMTEYSTVVRNGTFMQRDAYVVESGEYFWGGTSDPLERAKLRVRPVAIAQALSAPPARPSQIDPDWRKRCKELWQKLSRDQMMRQNDPVETIMEFYDTVWMEGWQEGDRTPVPTMAELHPEDAPPAASVGEVEKAVEAVQALDECLDDYKNDIPPRLLSALTNKAKDIRARLAAMLRAYAGRGE